MTIELHNIAKRFQHEWIFRNLSMSFTGNFRYAILGANGSGKSTLLQVLAGNITPTNGEITYQENGQIIEPENFFKSISLCAPYLELIEEFTLLEIIEFHFKFKKYLPNTNLELLLEEINLQKFKNRSLKTFSSGMKQRVKVILALFSDTPVLLLDEPCTNLDQAGILWYQQMMEKWTKDRLVIISSNQTQEYEFCTHQIQISDFKEA